MDIIGICIIFFILWILFMIKFCPSSEWFFVNEEYPAFSTIDGKRVMNDEIEINGTKYILGRFSEKGLYAHYYGQGDSTLGWVREDIYKKLWEKESR